MKTHRVLLAGGGTGGHVYPLIAVADALRSLRDDVEPVFVGTERGMEVQAVPAKGYELLLMPVLPLRGAGPLGALRGVARALSLLPSGRRLLKRTGACAVLSIGGYAAGPVSLAAWWAGVPLALLEPNAVAGLANRLTAPFVRRAYTAFPEPERHFRGDRVRRFGVPLRPGFAPSGMPERRGPLRVLVLGGSQGAAALNQCVPAALARLGERVEVVHQCGRAHEAAVREEYRRHGALPRVSVVPFLDDMPAALRAAELVIGRAGASAVSEVAAVGRPSLLIPYPHAAGQHQLENARSLERAGGAITLDQAALTPERLAAEVEGLLRAPERLGQLGERARAFGRPDAALDVARDLLALAGLGVPAEARPGGAASSGASGAVTRARLAEGGLC